MPTLVGVGFSQKLDTKEAVAEATAEAKSFLQQEKANIAIIFSTIHYHPHDFLPVAHETFPETKVIGCSTAGVITSSIISMRGIGVLAISSSDTHFAVGKVEDISTQNLRRAGNLLARHTIEDYGQHRRQAFIYFADGLLPDNSLILKGIQDVFGNVFPIVGAGSSDDFHFQESYQFCNETIMKNSAAGFLMGGHLAIGLGSRHGWKPVGKPRFVDRVEGNVIKSIDGRPASNIYDDYFGDQAQTLRTTQLGQMAILYPLGIFIKDENEHLLRNAVRILDDGSILCQGQVPVNSEVHIMIANKESCLQAATDAAKYAQDSLMGKEAKLVIVFESLARAKLLGRKVFDEVKAIKEIFGYTTPIIGMYSYGEICPSKSIEQLERIHLQNESITVLAIG